MSSPLPTIGDWATFEELTEIQDALIPSVLGRAANAPHYAESWRRGCNQPRTLEDFRALPPTSKSDLATSYPFELLAVPRAELDSYFESSGSSGAPTPAYYCASDWQDLTDRFARKTFGITGSDVVFVRSPYALGMAAHLVARTAQSAGATAIAGDNRSSLMPFTRVVRVLRELDVTLTWSNPTDCLLWAATAAAAGLDPKVDFPSLRALFVGGEPLSPARRQRISGIWGVPVIDEYGCSELGSLAGRCEADRLHLWADRVKGEVLDQATGQIRRDGEGELVLTPLHLRAMPLVRYNVEDLVRLSYEDCACGWKLPIIEVLGRSAQGYPVKGRAVTQLDVEQVVFSLPPELGVMFWRSRAELDQLVVQVESSASPALVAGKLLSGIREHLGVPSSVDVVPEGTLVPSELLLDPAQSRKPRSLYGPGESWDDAVVFGRGRAA